MSNTTGVVAHIETQVAAMPPPHVEPYSADELRAIELLDAEYHKEKMNNQAREGLAGGFFNRRDKAAVRAIVAAMEEARGHG